jgi:diguanylate cyclase (GGDEF)-like protein/PAS domain S-box-containing protein
MPETPDAIATDIYWSTIERFGSALAGTRFERDRLAAAVPPAVTEALDHVGSPAAVALFLRPREGRPVELVAGGAIDADAVGAIVASAAIDAVARSGQPDVQSEVLVLGLRAGGAVHGVLLLQRDEGVFGPAAITFAQGLADRAGEAFATSALLAETRATVARFEAIVDSAVDAIITFDGWGHIQSVNPATTAMFGWEERELLGRGIAIVVPEAATWLTASAPPDPGAGHRGDVALDRLAEAVDREGRRFPVELSVSCAHVDDEAVFTAIVRDVTEREAARRALERVARLDKLTGLANRHAFVESLSAMARHADESNQPVGIVFVDLDGFKAINDGRGHVVGDAILASAAQRLESCIRGCDLIARWGGDEFLIACPGAGSDVALEIAERLVAGFTQPLELEGDEASIGLSVGVACYPLDADGIDDAIARADDAMYYAKRTHRSIVRWDRGLPQAGAQAHTMRAELIEALEQDQLTLWYQGVWDFQSRQVGVEALIRWRHPTRGLLAPADFIPVAERTRIIHRIGAFVIERALAFAASHAGAGSVAINLSRAQLTVPGLFDQVSTALKRHDVEPSRFCLEITEGASVEVPAHAVRDLNRLRGLGVHVAIDDFGTGMSSLSSVRDFPADIIKIDQAFTAQLPDDDVLTRAVIGLAHELGCWVIAEGVENAAQLEALRRLGCDLAQGYHLGRPAAPDGPEDATDEEVVHLDGEAAAPRPVLARNRHHPTATRRI